MLDSVIDFFGHPFFSIFGGISALFYSGAFLYLVFLAVKGVLPVWYRMGISLAKGKIAIFASADNYNNLRDVLVDSKLFKEKNISNINETSIFKIENELLLLMHWESFKHELDNILSKKQDTVALIVYAPREEGEIAQDRLAKINQHRNVIVVNFRGRLINDVLVCMMTSRRP